MYESLIYLVSENSLRQQMKCHTGRSAVRHCFAINMTFITQLSCFFNWQCVLDLAWQVALKCCQSFWVCPEGNGDGNTSHPCLSVYKYCMSALVDAKAHHGTFVYTNVRKPHDDFNMTVVCVTQWRTGQILDRISGLWWGEGLGKAQQKVAMV